MNKAAIYQQINGILLVNKPVGLSSNAALQKVRRLYGAKKAGHSGSLDPLATGMLPVCFGEATKICQYLLDADKCYQTTGLLGIQTDSADSTGNVIKVDEAVDVDTDALLAAISQFIGLTSQVPSMYSALKHKGLPLYKYAREGIEIERKARDIQISKIELTAFDGKYFSMAVNCSKGTYIRNLVEDIGASFQLGAHVTQLHRCYTSGFEQEPMYEIDALEAMTEEERFRCLLPMDAAINHLPKVYCSRDQIIAIRQGKLIQPDPAMSPGLYRLYSNEQEFIGIAEQLESGFLKPRRLLAYASS